MESKSFYLAKLLEWCPARFFTRESSDWAVSPTLFSPRTSSNCTPTAMTSSLHINACGALLDAGCGRKNHGVVIKLGLDGLIMKLLEIFRLMLQKRVHVDSVSLSSILGVCAKGGFDERDIGLCNQRDIHLSNSTLDMCENRGHGYPQKVFANMNSAYYGYLQRMQCCGYEPDDSGDVETGHDIFDSMPCPNHEEALKMFRKMQFQFILSSYAELGLLETRKQVHEASQKFRFDKDEYVSSGLVNMYSKCGKMESSKNIFSKLSEVDVCWNSMIAAFSFFKQMRQCSFYPSEFSFATIGRQAQIVKDGYDDDIFVGSTLIEMYCKCGNVDQARYFFDMMPGKNTVTWNEMIHSYAENGYRDEAVSHYKDMITSGEKSDDITFVAVLTGCSHSALIDEGIVSRAGRFQEVEVILDIMPCKDDPVVWEVVLNSCRTHTNLSLAKRAAEKLFL
ncbi:Pentatricopeptide repeat-containing protein [Arachis hypogaea]|nr:Pentatricopeptide repeat-containing protein [Arachis hypogaea]